MREAQRPGDRLKAKHEYFLLKQICEDMKKLDQQNKLHEIDLLRSNKDHFTKKEYDFLKRTIEDRELSFSEKVEHVFNMPIEL